MDTMAEYPNRGPSRWFYAVGVAFGAVGALGFVAILQYGLAGLAGGFQRVVVPGERVLNLTEPGEYTIYHEYESVMDGRVYSGPSRAPGLECTLKAAGAGTAVKLSGVTGTTTYSSGNNAGVAIMEFRIDRPGEYLLAGRYASGAPEPRIVLAVGRDAVGRLVWSILGGMAAGLAGLVLMGVTIVVTLVKRQKASRLLPPPAAPMPPLPGRSPPV